MRIHHCRIIQIDIFLSGTIKQQQHIFGGASIHGLPCLKKFSGIADSKRISQVPERDFRNSNKGREYHAYPGMQASPQFPFALQQEICWDRDAGRGERIKHVIAT